MKIGILTFHRAENFGAAMQSYALSHYLQKLGHETSIIDYRCKKIEQTYELLNPGLLFRRLNLFKSIILYINHIKTYQERKRKKRKYEEFRNKYLSQTCSFKKITTPLDLDIIIAGSDQIWNLKLLGGIDKYFFIDFPTKTNTKKITFSASSEKDSFDLLMNNKNIIAEYLKSFKAISVREESLRVILSNVIPFKNISVTLDPTFLLDIDEYNKILTPPQENQKYIVIYHMAETYESINLAQHIANKENLAIIQIHADFISKNDNTRHLRNLGPLEILGYIKYANYVITNSFHGTALSIILEKEFWAINKYNSTRIKDLLDICELTDRFVSTINHDTYSKRKKINYDIVKRKMSESINYSKQYLIKNITSNI